MKVMILSVTVGNGHNATAKAIGDMLSSKGVEVKIIDTYKCVNKIVQKAIDKGYMFSIKHMKEVYRQGYKFAESFGGESVLNHLNLINLMNIIGASKFSEILFEFNPDVIVCTHVFAAQLVNELKKHKVIDIPTIGINTDYTILPYWENVPFIDKIVLASSLLEYRAVKRGIKKECILSYGIPVNPKFNKSISKETACKELGLDFLKPIVLLMGGGLGLGKYLKTIKKVCKLNLDMQLLVVCGSNKEQYAEIEKYLTKYRGNVKINLYGFVDNVDIMMSASDCIITKPGGLTVSEALVKDLPLILIKPIPGQEERNTEFLLNSGVALNSSKTYSVDECVYQLLMNDVQRERMCESIYKIIPQNSTENLCNYIMGLKKDGHI